MTRMCAVQDCLTLRPIFTLLPRGGSSRAARFARGAAALRQRARQRLASARRFSFWPAAAKAQSGSPARSKRAREKGDHNIKHGRRQVHSSTAQPGSCTISTFFDLSMKIYLNLKMGRNARQPRPATRTLMNFIFTTTGLRGSSLRFSPIGFNV